MFETIDRWQQELGEPVLAFVQQHFVVIVGFAGLGVLMWFFANDSTRGSGSTSDLTVELDASDGDGGDGGGD